MAVAGVYLCHLCRDLNSDHHTLSTFLMDLLRDPSFARGYVFQAAHYFLPEVPVVLPLQALGVSFATCALVFNYLIWLIYGLTFMALQRSLGPQKNGSFIFGLAWFSALGVLIYGIEGWKTSVPIFDLYFHCGQESLGLLLAVIILFPLRPWARRTWVLVIGNFLLACLVLSDPLILVQFFAPLGLALSYQWLAQRKTREVLLKIGFLLLAFIGANLMSWCLNYFELLVLLKIPLLSMAPAPRVLQILGEILHTLIDPREILILMICGFTLALRLPHVQSMDEPRRWHSLLVMMLTSIFLTGAAVAVKGLWFSFVEMRYLTNWLIFPWLLVGTFLWQRFSDKQVLRVSALVFVPLLTVGWIKGPRADLAPPPEIGCLLRTIDHLHLDTGFCSYWEAKKLRYFSGGQLNLIQVINDFQILDVAANRFWLNPPEAHRRNVNYVLINEAHPTYLKTEEVLQKFGQAQEIQVCGKYKILYYPHGNLRAANE